MNSNFISSLVASILPTLFKQVARLSRSDKLAVALYIKDLCQAYETGDLLTFQKLLAVTDLIPRTMQGQMIEALWAGSEQPERQ